MPPMLDAAEDAAPTGAGNGRAKLCAIDSASQRRLVLIAPQAFKGCLPAAGVAQAIADGVPPEWECELLPVADGGEGTVDALLAALGGEPRITTVEGPMGHPIGARWAILANGTAAIEMAAASGLPLVPLDERDPERATTRGTGQLIRAALDSGAQEIILGLGGSATNDGGAFALEALGCRLLNAEGRPIPRRVTGLATLDSVDLSGLDSRCREARLRVMCDVTNPLLGPTGATAVYGPQKGVGETVRGRFEQALERWASVLERSVGRPGLRDVPGAGAAGGLGFALLALGAQLEPGAELILDTLDFDKRAARADLVITGEGQADGQSAFGKATGTVARRARRAGAPTLAIAGALGPGWEVLYDAGVAALECIATGPMSPAEAQERAPELIRAATERAFRMMAVGKHASRFGRQ